MRSAADTTMKRKANEDFSDNSLKPIKTENDDSAASYSQDVKKKIGASARTGQACDRCRVRKMRCDDQPSGCAACKQNQSECKTTDRITGKATVRGYVQSLEEQLDELQSRCQELESRLITLGAEIKPYTGYGHAATTPSAQGREDQVSNTRQAREHNGQDASTSNQMTKMSNHEPTKQTQNMSEDHPSKLPEFRGGLAGNNYLGVSTGNSLLSSIRGTSMSVLGMEIDLANYISADVDEPDLSRTGTQPVYNKSYRAFVQTAFGTSPKLNKVELPPRSEGINYAHVFFRVVNPYLPIVHKPSFMATLTRLYDDPTFEPSIAETVMVQTMFAIMYSQYASRAAQNAQHQAELNQSSNFHYHYALGFFAQLVASHTLADVQALALLCLHVRNFPKPSACWMITSIVLDLAIELGLHRSARRWASNSKRSVLEIEIRKRVFWSLLCIHVIIAANLGRPVALRSDDFDVEIPEAVDDELLNEDGLDTSRNGTCIFLIGASCFPVIPIYMDVLSNIYAVKRSPSTYVDTVLRIEKRLRDWQEQWPPDLKQESAANNELGRVHAQYLALWPLQIRLLLRHPSLSLSTSSDFNDESLTICMDASRKMLHHVKQLQKYKSLDGTWQTGSLYVLALSTSLFGHWERKDQIDTDSLSALREDMHTWLDIIGELSTILGSGKRLQDAVRIPIDKTLGLLAQHLARQNPPPVPAPPPITAPTQGKPLLRALSKPVSATDNYHQFSNHEPYASPTINTSGLNQRSSTNSPLNPPPLPVSAAYPDTQFTYQPNYASNTSSYLPPSNSPANALPATAAAANAYLNTYSSQTTHLNPDCSPSASNMNYNHYHPPGSSNSWRTWAGNMASNLEPGPEYMNSATALMQLGGRSEAGVPHEIAVDGNTGQMWPFMLFDGGANGPI